MIELGYKKLYCPFAGVYHSHNYPLETYKQRFYDEYKGLYMIHKYVMVKDIPHLFVGYYRFVKNDLKYVNSLNMSSLEKSNGENMLLKRIGIVFIQHIKPVYITEALKINRKKWIKNSHSN